MSYCEPKVVSATLIVFIYFFIYSLTKNSENPDETTHKEPSHLDFHCLQMYARIYLMPEVT